MKVLDLQCGHQHVFEGWFASEDDFLRQRERGLVQCPVCGDASITKKLSAPRLNLGSIQSDTAVTHDVRPTNGPEQVLQAAWLAMVRQILSKTVDVGSDFAEEARKIHYGETQEHSIRGTASREETESLIDEGIPVLPFPLPESLKGPLH